MRDYQEVRRLWEECGLEIRPGDAREEVRRKVSRDGELFLVAEEKGTIVGTAMGAWDGRRGRIYHPGVHPSRQREGVATGLVSEIEERMTRKGVLKVNAIVFEDNAASLGFFKELGYIADKKSVLHGKLLTRRGDGESF